MPAALRLAVFYFAYFAYVGAFTPYFPVYLAGRGLPPTEIATVLAMPQLARVFAPAFWGWLADRADARRAVVVASCAALVAGFAAIPFTPGFRAITLLVALTSIFSAGGLPLVEAITLSVLAGRSGHYGPIRLWGSIGFIVAVLVVGAWLDTHAPAGLAGVLLVLALAALAASVVLPRAAGASPAAGEGDGPCAARASASVRALIGAGFCMAAAHGALYAFFTLHLQRLGYSGKSIGALWTLGVLAEILVFVYLPALFRRFSLRAILLFSLLAAVVRFAAIGWAAGFVTVLVIAQVLHAATFGAFHAASVVAVQRMFPAAAHARGQALFSSIAYGGGGAGGALLAGWAWQSGGPALTFSLAAGIAAVGAALTFWLRPQQLYDALRVR
ncbi:MAG TPA: MFS transporter [Burkholderiales bacterium]|nr:MFS transporter [Burkholderiales bacterium]